MALWSLKPFNYIYDTENTIDTYLVAIVHDLQFSHDSEPRRPSHQLGYAAFLEPWLEKTFDGQLPLRVWLWTVTRKLPQLKFQTLRSPHAHVSNVAQYAGEARDDVLCTALLYWRPQRAYAMCLRMREGCTACCSVCWRQWRVCLRF